MNSEVRSQPTLPYPPPPLPGGEQEGKSEFISKNQALTISCY
ncbi:MAG: hypothetical protein WBM32_08790 [Crocosphaera sp.]